MTSDGPRWGRGLAGLAVLGATLGAALDGIHTHFGATAYRHTVAWRMAWWVPLVFAGAFSIGLVRPLLERAGGRVRPAPTVRTTLLALALFVGAYGVSVVPLAWPAIAALLTAVFAIAWWLCDRTLLGLLIALVAAVGGPLVESLLVSLGTFIHLHPVLAGVSGWLPFLYLSAAVALTGIAKNLVDG